MATKPVIGVLLGDAAGVGPELVAKCAAEGFYEQYCKPIVIGDLRVLERALEVIGAKDKVKLQVISDAEEADWEKGLPVLDQKNVDPEEVPFGTNVFLGLPRFPVSYTTLTSSPLTSETQITTAIWLYLDVLSIAYFNCLYNAFSCFIANS